nr:hypothetical protein [Acidobacteriota bacterium]
ERFHAKRIANLGVLPPVAIDETAETDETDETAATDANDGVVQARSKAAILCQPLFPVAMVAGTFAMERMRRAAPGQGRPRCL